MMNLFGNKKAKEMESKMEAAIQERKEADRQLRFAAWEQEIKEDTAYLISIKDKVKQNDEPQTIEEIDAWFRS